MDHTTIKIYILIMLECRLSLEEACMIFGVEIEWLNQVLQDAFKDLNQDRAIKYLLFETSVYDQDNKKGRLKAATYYRRYKRILAVKEKEEKVELLNRFLNTLSGSDLRPLLSVDHIYNQEERKQILKYRLKYARNNLELRAELGLGHATIQRWEEELPEGSELKIRLGILRRYLDNRYTGIRPTSKR